MNDLHKFVPLQFHEQSPVSLEGFDIRKDDYDYLTKNTWAKELVLILVTSKSMSKSEQRDVIRGLFLSYNNHIILFYWLERNLKIKLFLKTFYILKRSPKWCLFNDSLQLFVFSEDVSIAFVALLRWCVSVNVCHIKASETCTWMTRWRCCSAPGSSSCPSAWAGDPTSSVTEACCVSLQTSSSMSEPTFTTHRWNVLALGDRLCGF